MNTNWENTEYTICPECKQVVDRESLGNHTHICNLTLGPPLGYL